MRLFYLENELGERKPLNDEEDIFLYNPSGLGIEFDNDYNKSGTGFFTRIKNGVSQTSADFSLYFMPNTRSPYQLYRELIDWISRSTELYFIYCPQNSVSSVPEAISFFEQFDSQEVDKYYKKIEVSTIKKGEIDKEGVLICDVSLLPLTPWFLKLAPSFGVTRESEDAMCYDFDYTDDLIYAVGSTNYSTEAISANGHMPAAIKLEWHGLVTNPTITLRGYNTRTIYGVCSILGTFLSSDRIVLSTTEQNSYVKKIDSSGNETDLLDSVDITLNPFFKIPLEEPCEIIVDGENILGEGILLLYDYYRGV